MHSQCLSLMNIYVNVYNIHMIVIDEYRLVMIIIMIVMIIVIVIDILRRENNFSIAVHSERG